MKALSKKSDSQTFMHEHELEINTTNIRSIAQVNMKEGKEFLNVAAS